MPASRAAAAPGASAPSRRSTAANAEHLRRPARCARWKRGRPRGAHTRPDANAPAMDVAMSDPTEAEHVERITDRLRRDHPDPAMRQQLYDDGRLPEYVRVLMPDGADEALLERVTAAVRAAEDGTSAA